MASWNKPTVSIIEKPGISPKALLWGVACSIPLWIIFGGGIWLIVTIIQHIH